MDNDTELDDSKDPVTIDITGEARFGRNRYCLWQTANGSQLICTIRNRSDENILTIAITGAPESVQTTESKPFNGVHVLPSNDADGLITIADFKGKVVSIENISAVRARCFVLVV